MIVENLPHTAVAAERSGALLLIRLGDRRYGLPLASVERVLPMAYVDRLPDSGDGLLGMLNLHGQVLPVVDLHARLGLDKPALATEHKLVLLRTTVPFLLWVEDVEGVVGGGPDALTAVPGEFTSSNTLVPKVLRLGEGIVPVLAPAALEPRGHF